MRKDEIKYRVESIIQNLDWWLESIDNETNPSDDWKDDDVVNKCPEMQYPYEAGVWRSRAGLNADKLRRVKALLLNEFKEIGVQSRK
jgi:hypothetical protein